jgi:hypothetical protein
MTSPQRSVRTAGRRRLAQATVGMVVVGATGVGVIAVHDAHASTGSHHSSSNSTGDSTSQDEFDGTGTGTEGTTPSGSLGVSPFSLGGGSQSAPQATTGGS